MMRYLHPFAALLFACTIWLAIQPASAAVFNPSTSRPVIPGDHGFEDTLQEVFDGIVTPGSIDDELDQTAAAIFRPAGPSSMATFIISIAGLADSNKFGIYEFGDPDNRVEIFDGVPSSSQNTVEVTFDNGDVFLGDDLTDKAQTGADGSFGTAFGFYLEVVKNGYWWCPRGKPYTLFSEDELNPIDGTHSVEDGDAAQALIYRGGGQSLLLASDGTFDTTDVIIGWEDLVRGDCWYHRRRYGPSDGDFQDLVLLVEGVGGTPVEDVGAIPEPSSLIVWSLLATLGISVGWQRKARPRRP